MMVKKKTAPRKSPPAAKLKSTTDLARDTANPRKISKKAATGLSKSLERFGDLSGIVFNLRTGELVAGHQRMDQIKERWGEREIELIDSKTNLHGIRIDDDHFFPVRVVDWSKAKQRAANVAANNTRIAGEFTDDLAGCLLVTREPMDTFFHRQPAADGQLGIVRFLLLAGLCGIAIWPSSPSIALRLGIAFLSNL